MRVAGASLGFGAPVVGCAALGVDRSGRAVGGLTARLRGSGGEFEVDLAFEGVDFGNLDFDAIAKFDHTASAASDELGACLVELVEVVAETRERDEAAHAESGDIDEKAEVADIGNEGGIAIGRRGL